MQKLLILLVIGALSFGAVISAQSANLTVYDSVVNLATNATKDYQFVDPSSGQSVTIAVTMTPYSESNASPAFTLLDQDANHNYTHMGINSGINGGDGNWVDFYEGVNFSASLVSASSGVTASSIQFGVTAMGIRPGGGILEWTSVASTNTFTISDEALYPLDTNLATVSGYTGELRAGNDQPQYQISDEDSFDGQSIGFTASFTATGTIADPRTNCWLTTYAGKYARIYTNNAMLNAGNTLTNWSNGSETQSSPAYCGIQEVYSSTNWIYVRSTGLASYIMGPWMNGNFPNLPVNQKFLYRFPRTNAVPTAKSLNGSGQIGVFVDGVEMFNSWDAYTWDIASNADEQNITNGYWNRDAYVNEGATFDPGYAHQQQSGTYHYHADPIALRYILGDHVDFNSTTRTYSEDTNTPTKHSPILGWAADGYPIYGPYGYSNATNASSGIRRMVSGYVLRNGQYGADNQKLLSTRMTIPQWAVRLENVSSNQVGPAFTSIHTNGCYMEDNDYLGDVINSSTGTNYQQGVDFDLDQYNGRFCDTPEFPGGIYAYFVAITSNGIPAFPYNIGRGFYGSPVGNSVTAITEPVVTNFLGNTNLTSSVGTPVVKSGSVTLTWSAIEGGSYQVESTTNLQNSWSVVSTGNKTAPNQVVAGYTNVTSLPANFYRVGRTSVATYDIAGTTLFATNSVAPGGSASRGQSVVLTITLPGSPPNPPANAPITSVTIGSISASNISDSTQGTVQALFTIPSGYTPTGSQNVVVTFQSPAPTYNLSGYFTIN
ncbi:MAG TPA: YHYH protein [Verrucomicrobiae bacterium]|jgi:hypothetical protein